MVLSGPTRKVVLTRAQELNLRNIAKRFGGGQATVAAVGSSPEAGTDAVASSTENTSYLAYGMAYLMSISKGFAYAGQNWNQAVGGASYASAIGSTQINAALALNPDIVFIGDLANDRAWSGGVQTDATFQTHLVKYQTLADKCIAANVYPIISGALVCGASADAANCARWNRVLARWCEKKGYGYIELRPVIARPQDGASPSGTYTHDGTHPNPAGAKRAGIVWAQAMLGNNLYSPWMNYSRADYSATSRLMGANLQDNGCATNSSTGVADTTGWSTAGSGSTAGAVLTTDYAGAMVSLTRSAASGDMTLSKTTVAFSTAGVVAGTDVLRTGFRHYATVEGTGSRSTLAMQHQFTANYLYGGQGNTIDFADSPFVIDQIPDLTATAIAVRVGNEYSNSGASTGVTGMGNVGTVNLTVIDTWLRTNGFAA